MYLEIPSLSQPLEQVFSAPWTRRGAGHGHRWGPERGTVIAPLLAKAESQLTSAPAPPTAALCWPGDRNHSKTSHGGCQE